MKKTMLQKCMDIDELMTTLENCASDDKRELTDWTDAELMEEAKYVLSTFREGGHANHDEMTDSDNYDIEHRTMMRRQYKALIKLVEG